MLTTEKTADYVKRWVDAFESKDLDRVLAFYTMPEPTGSTDRSIASVRFHRLGFEVGDALEIPERREAENSGRLEFAPRRQKR